MVVSIVSKKMVHVIVSLLMLGNVGCANNSFWMYANEGGFQGTWDLAKTLEQCLLPFPIDQKYCLWNDAWKISHYGTISFTAKAADRACVGISRTNPNLVGHDGASYDELVSPENFYEILISGGSNTRSVISKGRGAIELVVVEGSVPANPDTEVGVDALIKYKVILYQHARSRKNMIAVYYCYPGNKEWKKLMHCQDPDFIAAEERWFSFSNSNQPAFYQDISASAVKALPETRDGITLSEVHQQ